MKFHLWTAMAVGLLTSLGLVQNASEKELDKLQGTWTVVSMTNDGKAASAEHIKGIRFIVKGHDYSLQGGEDNYRGKLTLDASQRPAKIDASFIDTSGVEKGVAQGIYEVDGAQLKISWREQGGNRPGQFASTAGSKVRAMVLKREK